MKPLDFVKTPQGAVAIVTEVGEDGQASIMYLGGGNPTGEKNAWWHPGEGLCIIDSLPNLLATCVAHPFGRNKDQGQRHFPFKE